MNRKLASEPSEPSSEPRLDRLYVPNSVIRSRPPNLQNHSRELRPIRIFSGRLVSEQLVGLYSVELTKVRLVECAHALIPNY